MRSRHAIAITFDLGDFQEDVRRIFAELGRQLGADSLAGECSPTLDVYETDDTMEITVDLPGVGASAVRVVSKGDAILIAGEKPPRRVRGESSFHLVERGYGRFARVVRIANPCDVTQGSAALVDGELRISLPKLKDRRGRTIQIPVNAGELEGAAGAGKAG
jgi:HSP20 family protein